MELPFGFPAPRHRLGSRVKNVEVFPKERMQGQGEACVQPGDWLYTER